jgi:hypothetical protein
MTPSASVTLNPKITDAKSAQREMFDFVKNPPKDPVQAVKKFGSMLGVGAIVSTGITAAFPFAAPILPVLSGIFDLFSSGPSIGEMTLDAINGLSTQLSEGLKNLQEATENIVKEQAQQTINLVLQGADTIAREQSAVDVIDSLGLQSILQETYEKKNELYVAFLQDMQTYRANALNDLADTIDAEQKRISDKYQQLLTQVYGMIGEIAPAILDALTQYTQDPAAESDAPPAREMLSDVKPDARIQAESSALLPLIGIAAGVGIAFAMSAGKTKKR